MGQDQSAEQYVAAIYPCPNCQKIASIVRDWQAFTAFTPRGRKRRHQIGRWRDVLGAKQCVTCQSLVRLFDSSLYFSAYYSISATHDGKNLSIRLYEKDVDPEELSVS
jgi:hypothetical protein